MKKTKTLVILCTFAAILTLFGCRVQSGENGQKNDYAAMLALRTKGYADMPVSEYNAALAQSFEAGGEPLRDMYDRVQLDILSGTLSETISGEEAFFLRTTLFASVTANDAAAQSVYSEARKLPEIPFSFIGESTEYEIYLYFSLIYDVLEPDTLTIRERDEILSALAADIRAYLAARTDTFWETGEMPAAEYIAGACSRFSTGQIALSADLDDFYYYQPPVFS